MYELPENVDGWVVKAEIPCYVLGNMYFKPLCYLEPEKDESRVQMDIKNSGNIHLEISNIDETGNRLLTSIPYRDGWEIMVNSKEYIEVSEEIWIEIELDQGNHQIDMKFNQPMVLPWIVVSIFRYWCG